MKKVLITAFEPFDIWSANSSWLTLVELTKQLPEFVEMTTRLYPVDFDQMHERLKADLETEFDVTLHLGQSAGSCQMNLEMSAVNRASDSPQGPFRPLVEDAPASFFSTLPMERFAATLRTAGIPADVSFDAGTYLCNGIFYLSSYIAQTNGMNTQCGFIHLPLIPAQAASQPQPLASMSPEFMARGLMLILEEIAGHREMA